MQPIVLGDRKSAFRSGPFTLAFVGSGPAWDLLAGILSRDEFVETFPLVSVAGRVAEGAGNSANLPGPLRNIPLYPDCASLFAAHPDIAMACDFTADGSGMAELRRTAPEGVSLITAPDMRRFCGASTDGSLFIGGGARLRRAREIFSTFIDQVDGEVLVLDASGRVLDMNQNVVNSLGGAKADYIGRFCHNVVDLDICDDESGCPYMNVLQNGQKRSEVYTRVTKEGRMRHFRLNAFPLADDSGVARRLVVMRMDTTAHVQIEQRLQQSEKMAAIGELSTYIAHEIRNPLFAIGGFANSLLRTPSLDEAAREKVRIILEESRRLDEILKSIINFARPTDQTVSEVDANKVAEQTVELMGIGGEERHIDLALNLAENLPKVRGNAEMLKQCLINLVKNAQEAMPDGGKIAVRTRRSGDVVFLEVEDNGSGIPPELHEQVFSPFFSTKDKGAGLGLAMTRKIVGEMSGKVYLSSQPDKGTTISLALKPVLDVTSEDQHDAEQPDAI